MKFIIDIPDKDYEFVRDIFVMSGGRMSYKGVQANVINAIKQGTPYNPTGDLISREALKNTAKIKLGDDITSITILKLFEELIDNTPTVEPERHKGEWETVKGDYFTPGGDPVLICPFCHSKESKHLGGVEFPVHWNFCPNCGADMRKGGNE